MTYNKCFRGKDCVFCTDLDNPLKDEEREAAIKRYLAQRQLEFNLCENKDSDGNS